MLRELVNILERSFDRSGVFYVGALEGGRRHEDIVSLLSRELGRRGIAVESCHLDPQSARPFEEFESSFRQASIQGRQVVLVVWSLERLSERQLVTTLRWFSAGREWLSQEIKADRPSIPIVLLVNHATYNHCLCRWAGDLVDCLQPPFELALQ